MLFSTGLVMIERLTCETPAAAETGQKSSQSREKRRARALDSLK